METEQTSIAEGAEDNDVLVHLEVRFGWWDRLRILCGRATRVFFRLGFLEKQHIVDSEVSIVVDPILFRPDRALPKGKP